MFGYFEDKFSELYKKLAPEQTEEEKFWSAVAEGDSYNVQMLMDRLGFDANIRNGHGNTPLHVAAYNGKHELVEFLLQRGGDPLAKGMRSNSCLHYAAAKGHLELVKRFIALGVNVLDRNDLGKSAYDIAEGFGVKQYLMPLMFNEEQRTGTAPTIVGATVDMATEQARLANLPPPPKMSAGGYDSMMNSPTINNHNATMNPPQTTMNPPQTTMNPPQTPMNPTPTVPPSTSNAPPPLPGTQPSYLARKTSRPTRVIEPDGFVTTVGNPELAAKYGNVSKYRDSGANQSGPAAPPAPPTYNPHIAKQSPFSRGRYVTYDATNQTVGQPVTYPSPQQYNAAPQSQFGTSNVNVFTPSPAVQPYNPATGQASFTSSPRAAVPQSTPQMTTTSPSSPQAQAAYGSPMRNGPSPTPGFPSHVQPTTQFTASSTPPSHVPEPQQHSQATASSSFGTAQNISLPPQTISPTPSVGSQPSSSSSTSTVGHVPQQQPPASAATSFDNHQPPMSAATSFDNHQPPMSAATSLEPPQIMSQPQVPQSISPSPSVGSHPSHVSNSSGINEPYNTQQHMQEQSHSSQSFETPSTAGYQTSHTSFESSPAAVDGLASTFATATLSADGEDELTDVPITDNFPSIPAINSPPSPPPSPEQDAPRFIPQLSSPSATEEYEEGTFN